MKKILFSFVLVVMTGVVFAQFVAKMEVKDPIEGICDANEVYALFPMFDGQKEAICPVTIEEISDLLNSKVLFLKDHPKWKDKGMISLVINCKGEIVQCKMDNNTKSKELDEQIEAVFNELGSWEAGKLNGNEVDSIKLYSFKIKKGKIILG